MKNKIVIALAVVLIVALIGVGLMKARHSSRAKSSVSEKRVVRIADTKFMGLLPLYIAEENGLFEKQGLKIEWIDVKDPGQAANLFFSGQADYLMTTFAGALPAEVRQPGTLRLVCAAAEVGAQPGSFLLVTPNSPIQNVNDLRGKILGTYSGASQKAYALIVLDRLGLKEPGDYRLVQVPSSSQVTSLFGGTFDALFTVEPYGSIAVQQKARVLEVGLRPRLLGDPFWLGSGAFTKTFVASNSGVFTRFSAALVEANRYILENEKGARGVLARRTSIEPEVAEKCALYHWEVTPTSKQLTEIQTQFDLLESSKLIEKAPRAAELFSQP